ncbi:hypothetical protein [Parasediminibacterium sp. JCM 36343]|uniref:hypothetical protein n=1 Tax=Parasediminibacterium sp. JCM 36343 TaxID=3374279 RepID=UPI0039780C55
MSNSNKNNYSGTDLAVNYQLGFKKNKDQLLTTSYKYSNQANEQNTDAAYLT